MPVYVDDMRAKFGRMVMCHLVADTPEELHAMAEKIGVARKWFQWPKTRYPHYDIALSKRALAVEAGAKEIRQRETPAIARRCLAAMAVVEAGQRQCAHCGVFIEDDLEDILCGNCSAIYKQEMLLEARRAEWHAECRRDVFGI